jgi:hypothetical protein
MGEISESHDSFWKDWKGETKVIYNIVERINWKEGDGNDMKYDNVKSMQMGKLEE